MDIEILSEFFEYDATSPSGLRWRSKPARKTLVGSVAGSFYAQRGYYYVCLKKKRYLAHRVVWALCAGSLSGDVEIDHVDGDRSNNRIENLRPATSSENSKNARLRIDNSAGVKGLSRHPQGWSGRIQSDKTVYRKFSTSRDAVEKWLSEKREELHRDFARHV